MVQFTLTKDQYNEIKKDILNSQFDFTFEKNKLKAYLGEDLYSSLKKSKAIIAGGMISSLFTNKEINDVDVYFRDYNSLYLFAEQTLSGSHVVSHTNKATQFIKKYLDNQILVQIIHYRTYGKVEDIFDTYDFTVCMGAYDFEIEEFILHPEFLKHNSQRILRFNSNTSYPLISAIRTQKYEDKGYKITKAEYFRILMTCMTLDIKSYDELKEQLGGMYGESYDRLFDDVKDEKFDLQVAIDRIANFSKSESYFKEYRPIDYDIDDILDDLDKGERFVVKLKDGNEYRVINGEVIGEYSSEKEATEVDVQEFYKDKKFYKFVQKSGESLQSFFRSTFKYVIGEEVTAEKEYPNNSYGAHGKLFFNHKYELKSSTYFSNTDKVLIEVEIDGANVIEDSSNEITATKCKVVREVPDAEWKEWLGIKDEPSVEVVDVEDFPY
ncbi:MULTISPECIES: hypothetical protein [Lysinibacillus]|uniref:hypothetical protein n=1 Tax=Lysinibacillus TaxID=400634 RepID=UPI00214C30E3|nr:MULTISPECIES: hypothetical protein [Lysinibacillus]UUV25962.1 hypothetical protein NP781_04900 [Lysinibacillus sp. FN11]UYB48835.1 hypothetical protein OCI51_07690 [Lysinibacillus capsici]